MNCRVCAELPLHLLKRILDWPVTWRLGGAEGIRTPDLLIANETRYQLRHSPSCTAHTRALRSNRDELYQGR